MPNPLRRRLTQARPRAAMDTDSRPAPPRLDHARPGTSAPPSGPGNAHRPGGSRHLEARPPRSMRTESRWSPPRPMHAHTLAWAAFMSPRLTRHARRPRLDGVRFAAQARLTISIARNTCISLVAVVAVPQPPFAVIQRFDVRTDRDDPYAVLGVTPSATQEQIRRAYLRLLRQNHPDTNPSRGSTEGAAANAKLQQAIAANAILGDPASRAEYDHRIKPRRDNIVTWACPPPRSDGSSDDPPIQAGPVRWHRRPSW